MIPPSFEYHAPQSLDEALSLLSDLGEDAKLLAGGHSLLPTMKLRFADPAHLIDLGRIDTLKGISEDGDTLVIGAMTTENELLNSPLLREKCPLLPEAARQIADPQVRNCGTIGGDIAHGDPANDHPAVALALGAEFVLRGPKGERRLAADGFFTDLFEMQMAADEIMVAIRVPACGGAGRGYAYEKLKRKTGDWATAGTAVQLTLENGVCTAVGIGLTNLNVTALKAREAEDALRGTSADDAAIEQAVQKAMAICEPAEDLRGSIAYKTAMAGEMTRRAIEKALERARQG